MSERKFALIKDLVIPAGTVFTPSHVKTVRHGDDHFSAVIGLSKDTSGVVEYCVDDPEALREWFIDIDKVKGDLMSTKYMFCKCCGKAVIEADGRKHVQAWHGKIVKSVPKHVEKSISWRTSNPPQGLYLNEYVADIWANFEIPNREKVTKAYFNVEPFVNAGMTVWHWTVAFGY